MKYIVTLVLSIIAFTAGAKEYSVKEIPNVQLKDSTQLLSNPDGIVSPAAAAQINELLRDIRRKSSAEVAAVIVDDIDTDDIDTYATDLFREWGIGKKDKNNGVLLLVAKDRHKAVIRTGYGAEGVMPDILAGRIIRNNLAPHFREDDYDGGMVEGITEMHRLMTDPEAAAELMSELEDNHGKALDIDFFQLYLWAGVIVAILTLLFLLYEIWENRNKTDYEKYVNINRYKTSYLVMTVFFIGIPILSFALLWYMCNYWRNHPRRCRNCGASMVKLDEDTDNQYLTEAQDMEERLDSVDYDVWLCPQCGETDIYSFVNNKSGYKECPRCHHHTLKLGGTRVIQKPTLTREGIGEKIYVCLNPKCNHQHAERYRIPKKTPPPVIVPVGGSRGFGGGGGGFGGGGFGGGFTGGGGASGGW